MEKENEFLIVVAKTIQSLREEIEYHEARKRACVNTKVCDAYINAYDNCITILRENIAGEKNTKLPL